MTTISAGSYAAYTTPADTGISLTLLTNGCANVEALLNGKIVFSNRLRSSCFIGPFKLGTVVTISAEGHDVAYQARPGVSSSTISGSKSGCLLNVSASNTSILRAILAAGGGSIRGRIWFLGTSVTAGLGAGSATLPLNNGKSLSFPALVAKMLNAQGMTANANYLCGDSGLIYSQALTFDTRISGTVVGTSAESFGGKCFNLTAGLLLTFTPGGTFDTVELGYPITTAAGSFTVSVDGGVTPIQTINIQGGVNSYGWVSITVPGDSTAVTLKNATGTAYGSVIGTRTAASPGIEIINAGWSGSTIKSGVAGSWNYDSGAGWGTSQATASIDSTALNVFVLEATINDAALDSAGSGLPAFAAQVALWINRFLPKGDVIYRIPLAVQSTSPAGPSFNKYADTARDVAISLGCVVQDERLNYPDWVTSNALGLFRDQYHSSAAGYNTSARAFVSLCQSLV